MKWWNALQIQLDSEIAFSSVSLFIVMPPANENQQLFEQKQFMHSSSSLSIC